MNYSNIQNLLLLTFKAERLFFESAELIEIVEFSRFLHHQSAKRNSFCNKLIEAFTLNDIESDMTYIKKDPKTISSKTLKRIIGQNNQIKYFKKCLEFDDKLIDKCNELLNEPDIPVDILDVITKEMTFLTLIKIEGNALVENYVTKEKEISEHEPKVIPFHKGII